MAVKYMHVQRGDLLIGVLATTSSATLAAIWIASPALLASLVLLVQVMTAVAYCSSVITETDGEVSVRYGPGWIRRTIPLREILSCRVVKSALAYGWGVRRGARGYSYQRSQSLAVELRLLSGRRVRLGTDRPLELLNAILIESIAERSR